MKNAILEITAELIIEILKGAEANFEGFFQVIENGLPKDAKVVEIATKSLVDTSDHYSNSVLVKLHSEEFRNIPKGERLPRLDPPIFKTIEHIKIEKKKE